MNVLVCFEVSAQKQVYTPQYYLQELRQQNTIGHITLHTAITDFQGVMPCCLEDTNVLKKPAVSILRVDGDYKFL
jgi:hypothetical protein